MARYRRGGRGRRGGSGATAPAQSAVHSSESRQDSTGFHAGSSGHSSRSNPSRASHPSESNPSRAGQQGSYSALVSDLPAQEDEYPVAPQDSNSSEILAHAFIRGFRARTIKSLLRFIQRRATTTTGDVLEIRESRLDGNALIIGVKAEDLPRVTRLNGTMYARLRLAIRPYVEEIGPLISLGPTSNANSPRLGSDEHATGSQPADVTLLASHPRLASPTPDARMRILPGLDALASATATNDLLQQEFLPPINEEMPNTSTEELPMIKKQEIEMQLSNITGIALWVSNLCLSQADWNLDLAVEAVTFAQEFATLHSLGLQASILCLDYNLWNSDIATIFVRTAVQEVSDRTDMTMDWAIQCLEGNGWKVDEAIASYEDVKHLVPIEGYKTE